TVGGPTLAAEAIRAGVVDEIHLLVCPVVVGGGTRALPDDVRLRLELLGGRRVGNGVGPLPYRIPPGGRARAGEISDLRHSGTISTDAEGWRIPGGLAGTS